jgi:hypothetical protein
MTVTAPESTGPRPWSAARTGAVVAASLAVLVAAALIAGALALLGAHAFLRDDEGFYAYPTDRITTTTYALTGEPADVRAEPASWLLDELDARVRIRAATPGGPVFIGIAPQRNLDRWLSGVAHERVTDVRFSPFRYGSVSRAGTAPEGLPGEQRFWAASVSGTGAQTLEWRVTGGRWGAVVMNADGRRGVSAEVQIAAKAPPVAIALGIGVLGILVLGCAAVALRAALREGAR